MTTIALIASIGIVLVLPLVWRVRTRRFDPFEPLVLFALAWGVMFVVRPTAMLVRGERLFWGLDVRPTLPQALLLALVGAVAFVAGYELRACGRAARKLPAPRALDERVAAVGALVVTAVAIVGLAFYLPLRDGVEALRVLVGGRSQDLGEAIASSSTYVANTSLLLAPAALLLIGLAMRRRSPLLVAAAAIVFALTLLRVGPMGGRIVLLPLFGGIFVLYYVMRERRPSTTLLAALVAVGLLASYFTLHFRDPTDDRTLATAVEELRDRPHAILDPVLRSADAEMVLALSAALTVIPEEQPHRFGGATIGNLLVRPVPRELWEEKPLPPEHTVVATIWPDLFPALDPAFSPLLGLYWDFWLAGVALGMGAFGLLARTFYEWFILHRRTFAAQLIFAASIWFVVIAARNDPVDTLILMTFLALPVVAVVTIASEGVMPRRLAARSPSFEPATSRKREETG